jgi:hypothetical protein
MPSMIHRTKPTVRARKAADGEHLPGDGDVTQIGQLSPMTFAAP